jgi:prepilin-type N-terminal cleavage/methylation domain-containing protein
MLPGTAATAAGGRRAIGASRRLRRRGAFTLLEVIIALALCAILAGVVSSSLVTSLRAEQTAGRVYDGSALCDQLLAAHYTGGSVTATAERASAWLVTQAEAETGEATNRLRWNVWEVSLRERPSVRQRFAVRR